MSQTLPEDDKSIHGQADHAVRFDWGLDGALATTAGVDAVVVVDILSFTTAVTIGAEKGVHVYPYRWHDESAAAFADQHGAILAGDRGEGVSLSPASLRALAPGSRLVLPSPNGATICAVLSAAGHRVIAGSLRNAIAVGELVGERGWSVAVIAAGEQWRRSSGLRPCLEDLIGAGAIVANLGGASRSPEAASAAAAFVAAKDDLPTVIGNCASGRELVARGYPEDVTMAARYAVTDRVPVLSGQGFFAAS
ncbi:MAG: 2-phosphosulfolactate phosphatase [Acidimicrobiales bacterium]